MTDFFTLGYGRSCNTGTIVRTTVFPQACGDAVINTPLPKEKPVLGSLCRVSDYHGDNLGL